MPHINGVECDMDVEIKIAFEGGPFDGAYPRITLFIDPMLRQFYVEEGP